MEKRIRKWGRWQVSSGGKLKSRLHYCNRTSQEPRNLLPSWHLAKHLQQLHKEDDRHAMWKISRSLKDTHLEGKWSKHKETTNQPTSKAKTMPKSERKKKPSSQIQTPSPRPKHLGWLHEANEIKGVCYNVALSFTLKKSSHLKAKEELWKLKYFTMQQYNLPKNPLKETKNPSRYHNSITNLKFQHKPKYHLSKILI